MLGRQLRQISYILEHTNQITHVDGIKNFVADALSRAPVSSASICSVPGLPVAAPSLEDFAAAQVKCKEVQALRSSTTLTVISKELPSGHQLLIDASTPSSRILVPASLRQQVMNVVHELHHPGIRATRRLLRRSFIWPSMATAASNFVNNCVRCDRAKVIKHLLPPEASAPIPARRFSSIHIDVVGPLVPSEGGGHKYLLTIVDRHSRWLEAVPLVSTDTGSIINAFLLHWVLRFGIPKEIVSDQGAQFTS